LKPARSGPGSARWCAVINRTVVGDGLGDCQAQGANKGYVLITLRGGAGPFSLTDKPINRRTGKTAVASPYWLLKTCSNHLPAVPCTRSPTC
jgi:hypothetical protein